jgi:sugar phosphate isomerase/epimerase
VRLVVQENLVPGDAGLVARGRLARELGFDGLELRDSGSARGEELAAARAAGIATPTVCPEVSAFIGDFDADRRAAALDRLEDQLDGLAAAGGEALITPAAWGMFSRRLPPFTPPRSEEEDREVLLSSLTRLARRAEANGVVVLLEPLNRYEDHMVNTLAQAWALCEAVGSPAVRLLADTYHMNIEEDDPCAALRVAAPWLGEVHVSDSNRHQPGTGHVPFGDIVATLRDAGFDGVLGLECRLRGEPEPALRACAAHLRPLLAVSGRP